MRIILSLMILVMLTGIAYAAPGTLTGGVAFDLGNGAVVTVNGTQPFENVTAYGTSSSPASTFEITTSENVTQRFTPTNSINMCSDDCSDITAPTATLATSPAVMFSWNESIVSPPYNYQLARDIAFVSTFFSGSLGGAPFYTTGQAGLEFNETYFWHIHNSTSTYATSRIWEFKTPSAGAVVPGYLNITVMDELNFTIVKNYTATVYDGAVLSNTTTTGMVNFTGSQISSGQFQLVITNMTGYAERAIIVNSPGSYIVYVPTTSRTIDFVSFYLLDYTGRFPFTSSNLTITKGINTTHSQYFDSDAKVAANLIRSEIYTITVYNPTTNSMQQWGNYMSTGTGGVQVVIMDLGVNQSVLQPYTQRINASNASIDISWQDRGNVLNWVNMTVYKDNTSTPVYNLNTTIGTGAASYLITDLNATYITQVNASTTQGFKIDTSIFSAISQATGSIKSWIYGSFTMPDWVKNALAIIFMFMLAGSFGAMHRGEGAVITGIMGAFFWWYGMLSLQNAAGALFGAFVLYSILYHLETKRRQGGYF